MPQMQGRPLLLRGQITSQAKSALQIATILSIVLLSTNRQSIAQRNLAFRQLVAAYVPTPVVLSGTVISGHDGSQRTNTFKIIVEGAGKASLVITANNGTSTTQTFDSSREEHRCLSQNSEGVQKSEQPELCGVPAPWFFPYAGFLAVESSGYVVSSTEAPSGVAFLIQRRQRKREAPSASPEPPKISRVTFTQQGTLAEYQFSVPSRAVNNFANTVTVQYSDYMMWEGTAFPSRIVQNIEGEQVLDIKITNVEKGTL